MLRTTLIIVLFLFTSYQSYSQEYTEINWFSPPKYAKFKPGTHTGVTHFYKIKENNEYKFSLERYNNKYSFKNPSPKSNDPEKYMWPIHVLDKDGIYRWVQGRLVLIENKGKPTYKFEIAKRTVERYSSQGQERTRIYRYRTREYLNVTPMPGIFTQMFSELKNAYLKGDYGTIVAVVITILFILYKILAFVVRKIGKDSLKKYFKRNKNYIFFSGWIICAIGFAIFNNPQSIGEFLEFSLQGIFLVFILLLIGYMGFMLLTVIYLAFEGFYKYLFVEKRFKKILLFFLALLIFSTPYSIPKISNGLTSVEVLTDQCLKNSTTRVRIGAICHDGWRSSSTGRGTCSWHDGVSRWLYKENRTKSYSQCKKEAEAISWLD